MITFRPQRGTLEDSLKGVREFKSLNELARHLKSDQLIISYYGYDKRCDWDLWMVSTNGDYHIHGWIKG